LRENFDDINNDLLVKYLLGETSDNENRVVREWISSDPSNQKYFEHFKFIWDESKMLAVSTSVNEDEAWLRLRKRLKEPLPHQSVARKLNSRFQWMRIAALFILIAASATIVYLLNINATVRTLTVQTAANTIKDTLPDGSLVTLNRNSLISYPENLKVIPGP